MAAISKPGAGRARKSTPPTHLDIINLNLVREICRASSRRQPLCLWAARSRARLARLNME